MNTRKQLRNATHRGRVKFLYGTCIKSKENSWMKAIHLFIGALGREGLLIIPMRHFAPTLSWECCPHKVPRSFLSVLEIPPWIVSILTCSWKIQLIHTILGISKPWWSTWVSTVPAAMWLQSTVGSIIQIIQSDIHIFFSSSKAPWHSSFHSQVDSFLVNLLRGPVM